MLFHATRRNNRHGHLYKYMKDLFHSLRLDVWRQLFFPVVLPHSEMLPKNFARFCPESRVDRDEIFRPLGLFCRILDLVGEAEASSAGEQLAKE